MAENSKIEWTTHTFNPWIGCQKVSPGCDHCYAEAMSKRYGWTTWGQRKTEDTQPSVGDRKRTSEANWKKPLQWAKAARGAESRPRVFCASLADVFDNQVLAQWRADLFALIQATPELDWLLLTKRPENILGMLPDDWGDGYSNVWLGTTAEDQERALRRIPLLLRVPARVRFLSCEPMLSEIDLYTPHANWATHPDNHRDEAEAVDWVICGGESGHGARMMQEWWADSLRIQCKTGHVAFFMKQMTGKAPIPPYLMVREFPAARRTPSPAGIVEDFCNEKQLSKTPHDR